jgi:anti-sigma factor RsiW
MRCAEHLRLQAFFDGELDAMSVIDVERHVGNCPGCAAQLEEWAQTRTLLRGSSIAETTPAVLRDRILRSLDQPGSPRRDGRERPFRTARAFWLGLLGGTGMGAVAASLVFLVLSAAPARSLVGDLVADHTRALLTSRLIDVVSTDQHTVKPWFAGRTDVSPAVADFAAQGYRLLGGRVDDLDHRRAAVVVYGHGAHFIDVFSWVASGTVPPDTSRNGYHLTFWQVGDVRSCAVSDTGWSELHGLAQLLQGIN